MEVNRWISVWRSLLSSLAPLIQLSVREENHCRSLAAVRWNRERRVHTGRGRMTCLNRFLWNGKEVMSFSSLAKWKFTYINVQYKYLVNGSKSIFSFYEIRDFLCCRCLQNKAWSLLLFNYIFCASTVNDSGKAQREAECQWRGSKWLKYFKVV